MDFDRSEEHRQLARSLQRYLADHAGIARRGSAGFAAPWHMPDVWQGLVALGLPGAFVLEDAGGFGGTAEDVAVVFEEIGRGLCVEPALGTLMAAQLLATLGHDALLRRIIEFGAIAALAVCEPGVVNDLSAIAARATRDGGGWVLNGHKTAIYGGPAAEILLVAARTESGLGLFHVETPAMICAGMVDGGGIGDLPLADCAATCLSESCGAAIADALDMGRIALCAEAVGAMSVLIGMTRDYLGQRRQFGRALADFQALQHRAVDMVVDLEQCRSITMSAVAGFGSATQARQVALAKALVGRLAARIAEEAIQLHGGIGMTWEYPGAHYAKRLVMIDHQLGDRHDHLMRVIALDAGRAA